MPAHHPIAMASGIMPEATPVQLVEAAAAAGFDFGGGRGHILLSGDYFNNEGMDRDERAIGRLIPRRE